MDHRAGEKERWAMNNAFHSMFPLHLFALIAPLLALILLFIGRSPHPGFKRIFLSFLFAIFFLVLASIHGWHIFQWITLLEPNPSLTLTALLAVALWQRVGGRQLFRPCDWKAAWIFGSVAALVLYPMGLGLTVIDPYSWGWGWILPLATAVSATIFLLQGRRFGILLIIPLLGFLFHFQESQNFWDGIIDPFYSAFSLVAVGIDLIPITNKIRYKILVKYQRNGRIKHGTTQN
jgi:hypothetical protein